MSFIKQLNRPGLFTSDVIADRYQVLESDIFKGSYFIYDHTKDDIIRGRDGSTIYYDSQDQAMNEVPNGAVKAYGTKAPRVSKVAKEPKAPTEKRVSVHSTIVDLIKTTEMTDEEISAKITELFPDSKLGKIVDVRYRRRKVAAGEL